MCLLFVLMCAIPLESVLADKATDDFNLGLGFYRGKRWEQTVETLGQFLKEFPEHPRANVARLYHARSLSVLEQYGPAREEFATFLKNEPDGKDAADARYRLGECSYFLKDYPAAISQLSEYLEKHAGHPLADWAGLLLGDSYVSMKEYQKAVDLLTPLSGPQGKPAIVADARFSIGKAFEGLKRPAEAIEQYKAVAADKSSTPAPRALNRIASIQYAAAQYKESAATFEQLIGDFPQSSLTATATLGAGISWYRSGDYEKALLWLRRVPQGSSGAAQAILMSAMSLKELGQVEESRRVFADALKAAGDTPFAADVMFQQAQMERSSNAKELAVQIFEDIPDRWPQSRRTAESLFNAAELRLELDQREQAERLWNRLKADHSDAASKPREQILLGRIFLSRGDTEKAIDTLQKACDAPSDQKNRIAAVGRYYLVRAYFEAKNYEQVVGLTSSMADLFKVEAFSEVRGALALAAISSLQLERYEDVLKFAEGFLPTAADEKQKADVMSARAVALSRLKRFEESLEDLRFLAKSHPDEAQTWTAVLQSAEAALEQNSPAEATLFFTLASKYENDAAVKEAGLTGIAWSQFKASRFADAEISFARIVQDYPSSEDSAQSRFMQARSIEEQGDVERTAKAYGEVFETLTLNQPPAVSGSESTPPMQFAFDAGRQSARSLGKLKRIEEADKAWEKLVAHFPEAKDLDRILDEWAWLNVTAQKFERSDAIHRQLLERFPDSSFAGQARLSLAESLLEAGDLESSMKEMEVIAADARYGAAEKERALFHIIEIQAATRNWQFVVSKAELFFANYPESPLSPQARLFSGNALVELQKPDEAILVLTKLRDEIVMGKIPSQDWTDRVWIVLGEAALASKDYEQIDILEGELTQRSENSPFAFQMMDIQGRRWKQQAPPDFARAREYFVKVTASNEGEGTETAARCQFLLAETLVLEMKLDEAVKEYFKVYLNYSYDELRAQALFQAATCEARLQKTEAALRDYRELVTTFPQSNLVDRATAEIRKLDVTTEE